MKTEVPTAVPQMDKSQETLRLFFSLPLVYMSPETRWGAVVTPVKGQMLRSLCHPWPGHWDWHQMVWTLSCDAVSQIWYQQIILGRWFMGTTGSPESAVDQLCPSDCGPVFHSDTVWPWQVMAVAGCCGFRFSRLNTPPLDYVSSPFSWPVHGGWRVETLKKIWNFLLVSQVGALTHFDFKLKNKTT